MSKKNIRDLAAASLKGSTVVVRADLNVPLDGARITDDQRIRASVPTLRLLVDAGARVVLLSHLGRPKGQADPKYSLAPVARRLSELLGNEVRFVPVPVGEEATTAVASLGDGEVALLENTRFLAGDTDNDPALAARWAELGTLFVNDAFGAAHRAHASTSGLAEAMKERGGEAVAGLLMAKELRFLGDALNRPERPFVALLGGAKISGKIDVIDALLPRVDRLLIGGAMANTFFRALGLETGASLVEDDRVDVAKATLERAGDRLILPVDCVVAEEIAEGAATAVKERTSVGAKDRIADIGPLTRDMYAREIAGARTVVWNGPMGIFEVGAFAAGTMAVAHAVADACDAGTIAVLGGGDSAAAADAAGVSDRVTHVSTGGGASLEFLAGADLPGVSALTEAD
ncbi:MAG TPA: phosphoglycerate kinase [Longimicrobiales bacterium]|nr:phosphoglycerate kinase [Longimicrobiales bacterium]